MGFLICFVRILTARGGFERFEMFFSGLSGAWRVAGVNQTLFKFFYEFTFEKLHARCVSFL